MKRKYSRYCVFVWLIAAITMYACEKDVDVYHQDPRVYFYERANDLNRTRITHKSYTFLTLDENELQDTVYIKVKTMGDTAGYDRYIVGQKLDEGTTAIEGEDYDFIPGRIGSGAVEGLLPVVLYRTARLKEEAVTLQLTIGETTDFKGGVVEDNAFSLIWSDRLVQPDTWPYYFGAYSDAKYQFIIDVFGIADYPHQLSPRIEVQPGEFSIGELEDMVSILRVRLREYNIANPDNPLDFTF